VLTAVFVTASIKTFQDHKENVGWIILPILKQESLTLASMARDDPPASSTAVPHAVLLAAMRDKVGSEFET